MKLQIGGSPLFDNHFFLIHFRNALSQALRRRNLSFSQLTITDSNDNNQTPAFLDTSK